jgi:hypothetical protein
VKLGEKKAKTLKKLSVTATIEAQSPLLDPLVTVADVLHSVGKKVEGLAGAALQVQRITKEEDGSYRMEIRCQGPLNAYLPYNPVLEMHLANGKATNIAVSNLNPLRVPGMPALQASDGKALAVEQIPYLEGVLEGGKFAGTVTMVFRARRGTGEPAELVLSSHRLATADVPFSFENVPLP